MQTRCDMRAGKQAERFGAVEAGRLAIEMIVYAGRR